jgi:hypothetical protein
MEFIYDLINQLGPAFWFAQLGFLFNSAKKQQNRQAGIDANTQKRTYEYDQKGQDAAEARVKERGAYGLLGSEYNRGLENQMGGLLPAINNQFGGWGDRIGEAQAASDRFGQAQQQAFDQTAGSLFGGGYADERNKYLGEMARARTDQHNNILSGISNSLSGNLAGAAYGSNTADMGGGSNWRNAGTGATLDAITQSAGAQSKMDQQNIQDRLNEQTNLMRQKMAAMPMISNYEDDYLTRMSGGKSVKTAAAPYIEMMNVNNPFRYG